MEEYLVIIFVIASVLIMKIMNADAVRDEAD